MDDNKTQSSYSLEMTMEIWNDRTGERITVGSDRDGLDLIEITFIADDGTKGSSLQIDEKQAELLMQALGKVLADRQSRAR